MSKIIHNLNEFLEDRGFDSATDWSRCFYKYTDCGPWSVFITYTGEVYYEDLRRQEMIVTKVKCGCTSICVPESGEHLEHHVDCAADSECCACNGTGVHSKWAPSGKPLPVVDNENCTGIKIGSIVEGSEVESGPFTHMFPFDMEMFNRDVAYMEGETSFYWERDNSQWYRVAVREKEYFLRNRWGDIKWDSDKPSPKLLKKIEAFIETNWEHIPSEPGFWATSKKDWKPAKIPNSVATIHEYINDTDY